ncbi:MAG TPA: transglutaminase domain-containing protein [Salinivirgaceae bacterium]|nr:transglutaminase domain-containing protein [Salinivirgaceae bacterium]
MNSFIKTGLFLLLALTLKAQAQYSHVDKLANETKIEKVTVEKLASFIEQQSFDEKEKVRFLFTFIAKHIEYDLRAFQKGEFSNLEPDDVLRYGKAVCQGYSNLFEALCTRLGIQNQKVAGIAKGFGFSNKIEPRSNHTWNAVFIDNEWKLIDPTWGSGYVHNKNYIKHFNPVYFFTPPTVFVTNHLPEDPAFQLLNCIIKPKEFLKDSLEILKLTTRCQNQTYSPKDTLAIDYSLSEIDRLIRQGRRIASYSEFGLLAAAVMINTAAVQKSKPLLSPAAPNQERIQQAKNILELYNEALVYALRSKSSDAESIKQSIEQNISQMKQFIEMNERAIKNKSR